LCSVADFEERHDSGTMGNSVAGAVGDAVMGDPVNFVKKEVFGDEEEKNTKQDSLFDEDEEKKQKENLKNLRANQAQRHEASQAKADAIRAKYGLDKR